MTELDYSLFDFPSDKLTIGKLRSLGSNPELFFEGNKPERLEESAFALLKRMLHSERRIALLATERREPGLNDASVQAQISRHETVYELEKLYKVFSLSRGPKETERLVERIERAAAGQALTGRKRG